MAGDVHGTTDACLARAETERSNGVGPGLLARSTRRREAPRRALCDAPSCPCPISHRSRRRVISRRHAGTPLTRRDTTRRRGAGIVCVGASSSSMEALALAALACDARHRSLAAPRLSAQDPCPQRGRHALPSPRPGAPSSRRASSSARAAAARLPPSPRPTRGRRSGTAGSASCRRRSRDPDEAEEQRRLNCAGKLRGHAATAHSATNR